MSTVSLHQTNLASLVGLRRHEHSKGYDNNNRMEVAKTMMSPSSVSFSSRNNWQQKKSLLGKLRIAPMKMPRFSGLRGTNALIDKQSSQQVRKTRMIARASFDRYTNKAMTAIKLAQEEARSQGHNFVGTEQILLGLIGEGTGIAAKVLRSTGINLRDARVEVDKIVGRGSGCVDVGTPFTPGAKHVLELTLAEATKLSHCYIGTEHLLLGLLGDGEGVAARVLEKLGADPTNIRTLAWVIRMMGGDKEVIGIQMPTLEEYGTDLTKLAEEGELDPVMGRKEQIDCVVEILGKRTKNNPCLVGEPGVGKTAIAEGLAQRIVNGDVPDILKGNKVVTLAVSRLVGGAKYRGEFEKRLTNLMDEVEKSGDIILFIDEVHTLVGAGAAEGDALDAANIFKPHLARRKLQCIGATTLDEYRKHIEKDPALERRFQPVKVPEPTVDETIEILQGLRGRYEMHHKLRYADEALVAAAHFSHRYIRDRFLPDKAIDLIDQAGSHVRVRHDKAKAAEDPVVTESDILRTVSSWTGIPVEKLSADESDRLLRMEDTLGKMVVGQGEAVRAVCRAMLIARVGLNDPNRPIASFIFLGPTGVGKTHLARSVASCFFGSERDMIKLDMSEFKERHSVSRLVGSPPGYVGHGDGGQLTEAVRSRPYAVVLFDEIEKAHPEVLDVMLQILEDGRLTDGKGRTVDFKNTLIIMTSNAGSRRTGFGIERSELECYFRPEFLSRVDEVIVFERPTELETKEIADIVLREVFSRFEAQGIRLRVTERLKDVLVEEGYCPEKGVRGLIRGVITKRILACTATKKAAGEIKEGDSVILDVDSDGNVVTLVNNGNNNIINKERREILAADGVIGQGVILDVDADDDADDIAVRNGNFAREASFCCL